MADGTEWIVISTTSGGRILSGESPPARVSDGWRIVSKHEDHPIPLHHGMHRMICKLAWRYVRSCALDIEDLINEGYIALLRAQDKYDPSRASRSTFAYLVVQNHFRGLAKRWPITFEIQEQMLVNGQNEHALEEAHSFRAAIASLSAEAKEAIKIVVDSPKELFDLAKDSVSEKLQIAVATMLRNRDWRLDRITAVMSEIKVAIQKCN